MKKHGFLYKILIFSLLLGSFQPLFSEDTTPLPYDNKEFPQFLKDLRRFEIVSLGAIPFVTLDTTLVYSGIKYVNSGYDPAYTPNPFAASSYSTEDQMTILLTSIGISVGIGLTDFIVQLIKRTKAERRERLLTNEDITIYKVSEDPDALPIELPDKDENPSKENIEEVED